MTVCSIWFYGSVVDSEAVSLSYIVHTQTQKVEREEVSSSDSEEEKEDERVTVSYRSTRSAVSLLPQPLHLYDSSRLTNLTRRVDMILDSFHMSADWTRVIECVSVFAAETRGAG